MITCDFGSMIQDQRAQLTFTITYMKKIYTEFNLHAVSEQIQEDYSFRKPTKTNLIKHNACKSNLPEENIHGI